MNKLRFFIQRPKILIVTSDLKETVLRVLKPYFRIGKEILLIERDFEFFLKYSRLPVLAVNRIDENSKLAGILPARGCLILNADDDEVRDLKNKTKARVLGFGLGARADIKASDITPANFKINYDGKTVPVWLTEPFDREQIYRTLAASAVGEVLGLNLVEISEALKKEV